MPAADFESFYARVGSNLRSVPWALLEPHPSLLAWLDREPVASPGRALVVGCGLGDDAEEAARRGYRVVAFDVAPSAIRLARRRFPDSEVEYVAADLLELPDAWQGEFDLVVEIRTLQSLPRERRAEAIAGIAGCLRPGGVAFVRGMLTEKGGRRGGRGPLPLRRAELAEFERAGLVERELTSIPEESAFVAVYERPHGAPSVEAAAQSSR